MIRAQPEFANLPIIALTAQVLAEERAATVAAGMNAHLTKPIDEAVLYTALMDVLEAPASFSLKRLGTDPVRLRALLGDFLRDTAEAPRQLTALSRRRSCSRPRRWCISFVARRCIWKPSPCVRSPVALSWPRERRIRLRPARP